MGGVKGDAIDTPFRRFRQMVLSVADDGMPNGGELHPNLVLQAGHERYPDEGRAAKSAFDVVAKLCTGRFAIARRSEFLKHSFASEMMDECAFGLGQMAADDRQVLAYWSVSEELPHQGVTIALRLREKQDPRGKAVDAMDGEGALAAEFQLGGEQGERRLSVGAFDGNSEEAGRFVDGDNRVVFVQDDQLVWTVRPLHS